MNWFPDFTPPARGEDIFDPADECGCAAAHREDSAQGLQLSQLPQAVKDNPWLIIGAIVLAAMVFGGRK